MLNGFQNGLVKAGSVIGLKMQEIGQYPDRDTGEFQFQSGSVNPVTI